MRQMTRIVMTAACTLATAHAYAQAVDDARVLQPQGLSVITPTPLPFPTLDRLANPTGPVAQEPDVVIFDAGAHFRKRVLTSTKPQITRSETFVPLPGAKTVLSLRPGTSALVNVSFTAESRCSDPDNSLSDWCEVRILVNGAEAEPRASSFPPDTYAFDSTDNGTESRASWESHAMDRHLCVRIPNDGNSAVPVEVQWKVTNFDGSLPPAFWLDDWSLTVELARNCKVRALHDNLLKLPVTDQ